MEQLLQAQLQAEREGRTYAVVTIAEASGSVPRTSGKLLVLSSGQTCGTIGGGPAEHRAIQDALRAMDGANPKFCVNCKTWCK